ncbi:MAG: aminotransferase class I/II-fold pyridoxal phosphate-dependent enzyme [Pseudomonadota bacterium]
MRWPAKRITETSAKSFGMYERALPLAERGVDLIHLEVGRPSFDTPAHIKEAAKQALDQGIVHYGEFAGTASFREALAEKLSARNGIAVGPSGILVTNGLTHAAYVSCMAALDPGDEVIVLEPFYPQHINKIELAGGRVITAALDAGNGFRIDAQAIKDVITPRTRMLALVNPVNPTGRVYSLEELETLAALAIEHDLIVMSDEVYELIVFDDNRHISIASLPGMQERTLTQFAFTKAYAMDGWRLGYVAAPEFMLPALTKISVNDVAHVNVFVQEAGRVATTAPQDCVRDMVAEDCRRRDLVCERMNAMPGVTCPVPEGTIYAFPDVSAHGDSERIALDILEATGVVTEAGVFYGSAGEGHLRICFGAEPYERVAEAMDRLEQFFSNRTPRAASGL